MKLCFREGSLSCFFWEGGVIMSSLQGFSHIACVLFHPLICSNHFVSPSMFSWISIFFLALSTGSWVFLHHLHTNRLFVHWNSSFRKTPSRDKIFRKLCITVVCIQEKPHLLRAMFSNAALSDKQQQISAQVLKIVPVLAFEQDF